MREAMANYRDGTAGPALRQEVCGICARRELADCGRWLEFGPAHRTQPLRHRLSRLLSARAMHDRLGRSPAERERGFIGLE